MKTQIIQLEAHDDLISTRDKIGASKAGRVILVWPRKFYPLSRKLDLVLLQRHSSSIGIQLGLVSRDEEVRYNAGGLGIPVFDTTRQAQVDRWRVKRRPRKKFKPNQSKPDLAVLYADAQPKTPGWISHPIVRWLAFSLSLTAVLLMTALILPGAQVQLSPSETIESITMPVRTNTEIQQPLPAGEIPVSWETVIVEGRDTLAASGRTLVPEKAAIGSIEFTNLTEQPVAIPAGTVITTLENPVVRFFTVKEGRVPAGIGKTVAVPIQATMPGSTGNLASKQLQAIEGDLGLRLSATNPAPTRQGSDQPVASPTEADRLKLKQRLQDVLENTAQHEIAQQLPENTSQAPGELSDFPLLSTLELKRIVEEKTLPQIDQPAEELTMILRLEYQYQVVSAVHLATLAQTVLAAKIEPGYQPLPGTLRIFHQDKIKEFPDGSLQWEVTFNQSIQKLISPEQLAQQVRGLPVEKARQDLQQLLDLAQEPAIQTTPSWWPYLPYLPFRIDVSIPSKSDN